MRLVLAITISFNWPLRQIDVCNVFLHGFLKEEVYMHQPLGYANSQHPDYVCKLKNSLYSLKQAPRAWFERSTFNILHLGFIVSFADNFIFIFQAPSIIIYLLLYVDDIIITGNNSLQISSLIFALNHTFQLKDLGSLKYFLRHLDFSY